MATEPEIKKIQRLELQLMIAEARIRELEFSQFAKDNK